jgi:hypothetical protein
MSVERNGGAVTADGGNGCDEWGGGGSGVVGPCGLEAADPRV